MVCAGCGNIQSLKYCDGSEHCYYAWLTTIDSTFESIDKTVFMFYHKVTLSALNSSRAKILFKPLPPPLNHCELEQLLVKYSLSKIISLSTDINIHSANTQLYSYVKYICDTKFNMSANTFKIDEVDLVRYDIIYNPAIEEQQRKKQPMYLFHGSALANWCSILRTGLKTTNPEMMVNGNVYGNGIYMTDKVELALQYCRGSKVLCICELDTSCEMYNKKFCYVIPDENLVLIRSLVEINTTDKSVLNQIEKSLIQRQTMRFNNYKTLHEKSSNIFGKRITKELKLLDGVWDVRHQSDGHFAIYAPDSAPDSAPDIMSNNTVMISIDTYPLNPPIIYFKYKINHPSVNEYGAYLYDTMSNWSPTIKLIDLLVNIQEILQYSTDEPYMCDFTEVKQSVCGLFSV